MHHSEQGNLHALSVDMSQWRQDIQTFADKMQSDLSQLIDELSDTFSPVASSGFSGSQDEAANKQIPLERLVQNSEIELEETRHDKP